MTENVKQFIKICPFCQKSREDKVKNTTLPFTLSTSQAMKHLSVDSIGPLPQDDEGYQHILVVVDKFSRWVSLYPLRTMLAEETAEGLIQHCGTFGTPISIETDGGSSFQGMADKVLSIIGARHNVAIAHSHQEQGIVENKNKEIMKHLRAFLFEQTTVAGWKSYLAFVQRICNAEVVEHMGVAPAQIIFGNAIDLNRGILIPNTDSTTCDHGTMSDYVAKLIADQKAIIKIASELQEATDSKHLAERTAKLSGGVTEFPIGSLVLMDYPDDGFTKGGRPPNKLKLKLKGPLRVVSIDGPAYTLRDEASATKLTVAHVSRLRLFHHDKTRVKPVEISMKDTDQYLVESILGHRGYTGNLKKRSTRNLEFLVKWSGYTEPEWTPWKNLYANSIAHDYMKQHSTLAKVIPKRYLEANNDD
jgi:hypothetical protein